MATAQLLVQWTGDQLFHIPQCRRWNTDVAFPEQKSECDTQLVPDFFFCSRAIALARKRGPGYRTHPPLLDTLDGIQNGPVFLCYSSVFIEQGNIKR